MKDTAQNIFGQIGITDVKQKMWDSLKENIELKDIQVIPQGKPIFMRLNADEEIEYLKNIMKVN